MAIAEVFDIGSSAAYSIRPAVEADIASLLQMSRALAQLDGYAGSIALPDDVTFYVAVAPSIVTPRGLVIGMICIRQGVGDTPLISHLFVQPAYRRRGVGTALFAALGVERAELVVHRSNTAAVAFLGKAEFLHTAARDPRIEIPSVLGEPLLQLFRIILDQSRISPGLGEVSRWSAAMASGSTAMCWR